MITALIKCILHASWILGLDRASFTHSSRPFLAAIGCSEMRCRQDAYDLLLLRLVSQGAAVRLEYILGRAESVESPSV